MKVKEKVGEEEEEEDLEDLGDLEEALLAVDIVTVIYQAPQPSIYTPRNLSLWMAFFPLHPMCQAKFKDMK